MEKVWVKIKSIVKNNCKFDKQKYAHWRRVKRIIKAKMSSSLRRRHLGKREQTHTEWIIIRQTPSAVREDLQWFVNEKTKMNEMNGGKNVILRWKHESIYSQIRWKWQKNDHSIIIFNFVALNFYHDGDSHMRNLKKVNFLKSKQFI